MSRRTTASRSSRPRLRAAGEPIRGLPVKEISVGRMLESLFSITRDFDMPTQPHLLLLQKTMVMNEGVATALDPDINMWETAEPFLKEWIRSELGPEAYYADRIIELVRAVKKIPELIDRLDEYYPPRGAAPPAPPLPEIAVIEEPQLVGLCADRRCRRRRRRAADVCARLGAMARVLLIVGGGIAAYKSLELVRLLKKAGHAGHAGADQGRRAFRHRDEPRHARREPGPQLAVGAQGRGRDRPHPAVAARPISCWSARRPPTCWRRWRRGSPTISQRPCCSRPTSRWSSRRR